MKKKSSSSKKIFGFLSRRKTEKLQPDKDHAKNTSEKELEGSFGKTISYLCRTGLVQIGDKTYEAISASGTIAVGEKIIVMGKSFGLLIVKPFRMQASA